QPLVLGEQLAALGKRGLRPTPCARRRVDEHLHGIDDERQRFPRGLEPRRAVVDDHPRARGDCEQPEPYAEGSHPGYEPLRWCAWSAHSVAARAAASPRSVVSRLPANPPLLPALLDGERRRTVLVEQLEDSASAARDTRERIVGDDDRQAGLLRQQLVDVREQRAAPGQHDAALRDVRAELGRGLLESDFDGSHYALQGLL